jgi:insertion element IS1 protein InsB
MNGFWREVSHVIGKDQTQQSERTNGIVRQQTGRWRHEVSPLGHRRQNKFAKAWEQTQGTVRLVVSYFNWIWVHSRKENTAAMRVGLAISPWTWHDMITYPTLC